MTGEEQLLCAAEPRHSLAAAPEGLCPTTIFVHPRPKDAGVAPPDPGHVVTLLSSMVKGRQARKAAPRLPEFACQHPLWGIVDQLSQSLALQHNQHVRQTVQGPGRNAAWAVQFLSTWRDIAAKSLGLHSPLHMR